MSKVLQGGTLFDGIGDAPLHDAVVIIRDSKIGDVYSDLETKPPVEPDAEVYDLAGKFILPGLIDCHVHLWLNSIELNDLAAPCPERDALLVLQAARNAETALRAGITTVCDCGAPRKVAFDLGEAASNGLVSAPRLMLCGRPLTITGGHCHSWGGEADGVEGVRQAVRQLVKEGADFIKVMATGGVCTPGTEPVHTSYTSEELRAIVDEAHRFGRRVTAHCHGTAGIAAAIEAGLDSIEHATFLDENYNRSFNSEIAKKIESTGIWVVPTLAAGHRTARRVLEASAALTERQQIVVQTERKLEIFRRMSDMGLKMAAGSDAGVPLTYFDDLIFELELMVEAGATPLQAVRSGTKESAALIGRTKDLGTIERGKEADILVVDEDPSKDVKALRAVAMVVRAGEMVYQQSQVKPMPRRPPHER